MLTKHTHGPWLQMARVPTNVIAASGIRVARCDFDGDATHPDCLANAKLVAAAPDLLEAVKDALAFLDRPDITTYEWYKLAPDHIAKFRAAIAKAEGK